MSRANRSPVEKALLGVVQQNLHRGPIVTENDTSIIIADPVEYFGQLVPNVASPGNYFQQALDLPNEWDQMDLKQKAGTAISRRRVADNHVHMLMSDQFALDTTIAHLRTIRGQEFVGVSEDDSPEAEAARVADYVGVLLGVHDDRGVMDRPVMRKAADEVLGRFLEGEAPDIAWTSLAAQNERARLSMWYDEVAAASHHMMFLDRSTLDDLSRYLDERPDELPPAMDYERLIIDGHRAAMDRANERRRTQRTASVVLADFGPDFLES